MAKLGMSLLGAAMKKGAGTAVTSGLASSLGKSALGALTGSTGGGKGGGKGGGMGGGKGGGRGGQGGMSGKGGQGGQGGGSSRGGQGGGQKGGQSKGQGRSSQNQQDEFSLEDALNMLLEQNSPKNQVQEAPKQSANLRKLAQSAQNQDEEPYEEPYGVRDVVAQESPTAPSLSDEDQVQIFQAAIDVLQAHIVSFSAGRVRVRHPQLQQSQDHAALQNALLQEGLSDVSFKASTGSALIIYDAKRFSQETFLVAALPLAIYLVCGRLA